MAGPTNAPEPKMDVNDLYREDIYSDRKVGTIRVLTPVKPDGTPDPARATSYVGQAQIMTPAGAAARSSSPDRFARPRARPPAARREPTRGR
jgi:hypothetical protein